MPRFSKPIIVDGKMVGIMCGSRPDHRCSSCGYPGATIQCDFAVKTKSGTCDRWLCKRCAVHVGPNKDYCPAHDRLAREAKTP